MKKFSLAALVVVVFVLGCGPSDSDFEPDPATIPNITPVYPGDREAGGPPGGEGGAPESGKSDGLGQLPTKGG